MVDLTEIILHKISRTVEFHWANGEKFVLPCYYLRQHSPSAETKLMHQKLSDSITILSIQSVGNYAVRFIFSDGHQTGIYSWKTLFALGKNYVST